MLELLNVVYICDHFFVCTSLNYNLMIFLAFTSLAICIWYHQEVDNYGKNSKCIRSCRTRDQRTGWKHLSALLNWKRCMMVTISITMHRGYTIHFPYLNIVCATWNGYVDQDIWKTFGDGYASAVSHQILALDYTGRFTTFWKRLLRILKNS